MIIYDFMLCRIDRKNNPYPWQRIAYNQQYKVIIILFTFQYATIKQNKLLCITCNKIFNCTRAMIIT